MLQAEENTRVFRPRRLAFAAVGVLVMLYEEAADYGSRWVERGQRLEQEQLPAMTLAPKFVKQPWLLVTTVPRQAYHRTVETLWHLLDVPTAADYEALGAGVAHLDRALAELNSLPAQADNS